MLPVKAVVMNTVSIGAAFGVVTWIFAEGHLEGLLGFTSTGFLDVTQPILMLAILFGLSMDYEVFLMSRIKEEYSRTDDPDEAILTGFVGSSRVVTAAAVIMLAVFAAFGRLERAVHHRFSPAP